MVRVNELLSGALILDMAVPKADLARELPIGLSARVGKIDGRSQIPDSRDTGLGRETLSRNKIPGRLESDLAAVWLMIQPANCVR